MSANPEIIAQLQDFRQRVLQADKLRRQGEEEEARKLEPSNDEIIQAIKAFRESMQDRKASRTSSAQTKTKAKKLEKMEDLSALFD